MRLYTNRMSNPNPVSCKQVQNLDLAFFVKMLKFINFIKMNFIKMSFFFTLLSIGFYCQIMDCELKKQTV